MKQEMLPQSDLLPQNCIQENHSFQAINFICLNESCKEQSYGCLLCMQEKHNDHPSKIYNLKYFNYLKKHLLIMNSKYIERIESIILKTFQSLISWRQQLIENNNQLNVSFEQLTQKQFFNIIQLITQNISVQVQEQQFYKEINNEINNMERYFTSFLKENKLDQSQNNEQLNISQKKNSQIQQQLEKEDIQLQQIPIQEEESTSIIEERIKQFIKEKQNSEALLEVKKLIVRFPQEIKYLEMQGQLQQSLKQYNMVFNTYDKLLDYNPSHIGYFINKITSLIELEQFDKALELLDVKIEMYPENIELYYRKAICLFKKRNFNEAFVFFTYVNEHQVFNNPQLIIYFANCLRELGKAQDAMNYLGRQLQSNQLTNEIQSEIFHLLDQLNE